MFDVLELFLIKVLGWKTDETDEAYELFELLRLIYLDWFIKEVLEDKEDLESFLTITLGWLEVGFDDVCKLLELFRVSRVTVPEVMGSFGEALAIEDD